MPVARARGDTNTYSDIRYSKEGSGIRITATRYSELKRYSSPISLLVGACKPGRNGLVGLAQRIEIHSPLALVVLMLGTNDFQSMHEHNAWHSSQGIAALVSAIRGAPIELGMPVPPILVVAPPPIRTPKGPIAPKFAGGENKCVGLAAAYETVCRETGCHFFDAGAVVTSSIVDGVHLDAGQHMILGKALAAAVVPLLHGGAVQMEVND